MSQVILKPTLSLKRNTHFSLFSGAPRSLTQVIPILVRAFLLRYNQHKGLATQEHTDTRKGKCSFLFEKSENVIFIQHSCGGWQKNHELLSLVYYFWQRLYGYGFSLLRKSQIVDVLQIPCQVYCLEVAGCFRFPSHLSMYTCLQDKVTAKHPELPRNISWALRILGTFSFTI